MALKPNKIQSSAAKTQVNESTLNRFLGPVKDFLYSAEFAELARLHPADFTRQQALPLPHLVSMLLNLRKGSIGDALDRFFEVFHDQPLAESVSPSAFCQARMKLAPRALMALNGLLLEGFERHFSPRLWHGFRLLAVDGSTAGVPNTDDVIATFGEPPEHEGQPGPVVRLQLLTATASVRSYWQ